MRYPLLTLSALLLAIPSAQAAGDAAAGAAKAVVCGTCHGANGKSMVPAYPNLAGQHAEYLESALKAYRDGGRTNPIMNPMAKPLTDADIANLAAHFSSLPPG